MATSVEQIQAELARRQNSTSGGANVEQIQAELASIYSLICPFVTLNSSGNNLCFSIVITILIPGYTNIYIMSKTNNYF